MKLFRDFFIVLVFPIIFYFFGESLIKILFDHVSEPYNYLFDLFFFILILSIQEFYFEKTRGRWYIGLFTSIVLAIFYAIIKYYTSQISIL